MSGQRIRTMTLGLILLAGLVLATASHADNPGQFAVGGGRSFAAGRDYVQFAFSAHNGPNGTTSGHITLNWPPAASQEPSDHGQVLARVVCLQVVGHTATAYGVVTKSENPDWPQTADWVGISVSDRPDRFLGFFGFGAPPCTWLPVGVHPVTRGNIVIQD